MRVVRIAILGVFAFIAACGSSGGGPDGPDSDPSDQQDDQPDEIPGETTSKVRYMRDRTQSPITAAIANNIRAIAGTSTSRNDDMFMKVGDSITDSFAVMSCFADGTIDLAGRNDLQDSIDFYGAANVSGASPCNEEWCQGATTSYNRASYAAEGGTTADYPLSLTPRPLDQEDNAIKPRVALVEFGTNDSTLITTAAGVDGFVTFHGRMQALVDTMASRGIVPVLYTIPPYIAPRPGYLNVPTMNAIIRVIAQSRAIPLIDFERELLPLPDYGLWDGTHPKVEFGGCVFTSAGLQYGYNV
ncbi:MAG TPA: SGNH/GDSL hydrolase family protein, partial [Myxococcota bacterium]|nr:SGNH/GDSL hydrolase family protein [Myxococcota bacterium]